MLNRILEINEENRFISLSRGFIVVRSGDDVLGKVPVDDVSVLLISAQGATVTKNVLNAITENGGITVLCGKNYAPQSMLLPITANCFYTKIVKMQINASEPLKKRIWQQIIIKKIKNQAQVLKLLKKNSLLLENTATTVKSGDSDNREGFAAKVYWTELFGNEFIRNRDEEGINALLNYGYAVMRACMARAICSAGLIPALGINHKNMLNPFCLADDFFEIYRPIVDFQVYEMLNENQTEVNPKNKQELTKLLWVKVHTEKGDSPVFQSMHYMVASFVHALEEKNPVINLPEWKGNFYEDSGTQ